MLCVSAVLRHCAAACGSVLDALGASPALSARAAERLLGESLVHDALPLLPVACRWERLLGGGLLEDEGLADGVARLVEELVGALQRLAPLLPGVLRADGFLAELASARVHGALALGDGDEAGPRRLQDACFDPSEKSADMVIEGEGRLVRSTSGSNQHCLVGSGFRSGRGAWEFRLESDTADDECSLLGAATKPLLCSNYENNASMWLLRSYNGQLYHGGASGLPAAAKVHPGDLVRFEVDMERRTMSVAVNGKRQRATLTDLRGPLYPCVVTYRPGIVVRLVSLEVWDAPSGAGARDASPPPPLFAASAKTMSAALNASSLPDVDHAALPAELVALKGRRGVAIAARFPGASGAAPGRRRGRPTPRRPAPAAGAARSGPAGSPAGGTCCAWPWRPPTPASWP